MLKFLSLTECMFRILSSNPGGVILRDNTDPVGRTCRMDCCRGDDPSTVNSNRDRLLSDNEVSRKKIFDANSVCMVDHSHLAVFDRHRVEVCLSDQ